MKKISVYIPAYNAESTIEKCIKSILSQSYPVEKIIIIDDGSTDKTAEIVSEYPVTLIKHSTNKGIAAARNTALNNVSTEFISSVDADCCPEKQWLEKLIKLISGRNISGAGGNLIEVHTKGLANTWRTIHMGQNWGNRPIYNPPFLYGNNCIYKTADIKKAGVYKDKYKTNYEDFDICKKLYKMNKNLIYTPHAKVYHYRKDNILSVTKTFWNWIFYEHNPPSTIQTLIGKIINTNLRMSISFFFRDLYKLNFRILPLDLYLGFYHSLLDYNYYKTNGKK